MLMNVGEHCYKGGETGEEKDGHGKSGLLKRTEYRAPRYLYMMASVDHALDASATSAS